MAEDNKPKTAATPLRQVPPLKQDDPGVKDPAAKVNDPASSEKTNPGPRASQQRAAHDEVAVPKQPVNAMGGAGGYQRVAPNQPVVPAPSENVFPGPVGRPDPSRTGEERQAVADAAIEAHTERPGHLTSGEFQPEGRTSDGEPDESKVPEPKAE